MRNILIGAIFVATPFPSALANCRDMPIVQSATKARDIDGIALGSSLQDLKARYRIEHVAGETYSFEDGDTSYEIGVTNAGRIFRLESKQRLGDFVPDRQLVLTITNKLSAKYGEPASNQLPGGPVMWGLVERVTDASGASYNHETNWASMMLTRSRGMVFSSLKMLDWRIVWQDDVSRNCRPARDAEAKVRF